MATEEKKEISRREFLAGGACAATGFIAAGSVSCCAGRSISCRKSGFTT